MRLRNRGDDSRARAVSTLLCALDLLSAQCVQRVLSALGTTAWRTRVKRMGANRRSGDLLPFSGAVLCVSHGAWSGSAGRDQALFSGSTCVRRIRFRDGVVCAEAHLAGRATWWLPTALLAGMVLAGLVAGGLLMGKAQPLSGAPFMSHTLWIVWIC